MQKTGVILLNLGGPDSPEAVRPFLYNLFSDRQIIKLGPSFMQKPLAWLIAKLRAQKAIDAYAQIGGASPILDITRQQAKALERELKQYGDFAVYVAMRYWRPYAEEAIVRAEQEGVDRLMSLTLYPQYSIATTGSSECMLYEALKDRDIQYIPISGWHDNPQYIEALSSLIEKDLRPDTALLFSAHSLPVSFIEGGDPYQRQVEETVRLISERLGRGGRLAYQSRSGPVKWLGPSVEEELRAIASEGIKDVLIVPVSFVSDHIETLYEIDILYKGIGEGHGMSVRRSESLNTHPKFIRALAGIVMDKLREARWA